MRESNINYMKWNRQPQETEGTYMFSGQFVATRGVVDLLSREEIQTIYNEIRFMVAKRYESEYL